MGAILWVRYYEFAVGQQVTFEMYAQNPYAVATDFKAQFTRLTNRGEPITMNPVWVYMSPGISDARLFRGALITDKNTEIKLEFLTWKYPNWVVIDFRTMWLLSTLVPTVPTPTPPSTPTPTAPYTLKSLDVKWERIAS